MTVLTIAKLARAAGLGVETVRYYQRRGLMPGPRASGKTAYRENDQSHVQLLLFIRPAQAAGFTLKEIKELLAPDPTRDRDRIRDLAGRRLEDLGRLGAAELEQLVEVGADWTWQTDARHHFTHFSSGVEAATGLKPARAVGKSWFDFFSDAARRDRKYEMHVADLKALRPFRDFIYEIAKPGENCRYVSVSGFPRFDEDGAFAGYCGSGRNVTAMVEALDELRETRRALALGQSRKKLVHDAEGGRSHAERLMAALNAMHDAFCYYDSNNTLVLFNDAMVDMYAGLEDIIRPGVSFETMMATALERGVILAGGASPETLLRQVLANRREQDQWEAVLAFGDGRFCMHREIRTDDGGTIGICTDVTDLKRREEELARAKDRSENLLSDLQRTIDSMAMGVVLVDAELRAETINRAFYEIWKVTPQDVAPGSHFRALMDVNRHKGIYDVPDAEWEGYVSSRLAEIRAGDVAAREFHRADGCTMIYSVTALSGGRRLISYYDVTELKERERALGVSPRPSPSRNRYRPAAPRRAGGAADAPASSLPRRCARRSWP